MSYDALRVYIRAIYHSKVHGFHTDFGLEGKVSFTSTNPIIVDAMVICQACTQHNSRLVSSTVTKHKLALKPNTAVRQSLAAT